MRVCVALLALGVTFTAGACAMPSGEPAARREFEEPDDPLEPLHRRVFDFNQFVDRNLLRPAARAYRNVVPEFGRNAIRHFIDNLGEPLVFANDLLQGEVARADHSAGRFLMNSIFGLGGVFDLASANGLPRETGDFGQTMYRWGVPGGPYIVLPVIGPSNTRDTVGKAIDGFADPYGRIAAGATAAEANWGRRGVGAIDERARNIEVLDELQRNAVDLYARMRSVYRQRRAQELRHGAPASPPDCNILSRHRPESPRMPPGS